MSDSELDPSELGTKTYWKEAYVKEIANFEDHGDTGDVWFGEDSADRVIEWICQCGVDKSAPVIDLGEWSHGWDGCGNGYTLTELARAGFTDLLGVDYCQEAITLAERVAREQGVPHIKYQVFDITTDDASSLGKFSVVHDKGTYDAISLNPQHARQHRELYIQHAADMLDNNGVFIITSCNWTEEELIKQFSTHMSLQCVIPTPQFRFGGKVGSVVSSVVFTPLTASRSNTS